MTAKYTDIQSDSYEFRDFVSEFISGSDGRAAIADFTDESLVFRIWMLQFQNLGPDEQEKVGANIRNMLETDKSDNSHRLRIALGTMGAMLTIGETEIELNTALTKIFNEYLKNHLDSLD